MKNNDFNSYINSLSSNSYSPGGGSASSHILKIADALFLKSINITKSRKSFSSLDVNIINLFENVFDKINEHSNLLDIVNDADIELFNQYMIALNENDNNKLEEIIDELINGKCGKVIISCTIDLVRNVLKLNEYIVKSIKSDFRLGLRLISPTLNNYLENINENIKSIKDEYKKEKYINDMDIVNKDIINLIEEINEVIK